MNIELPKAVEVIVDRLLWPILRPYKRFVIFTCVSLILMTALAAFLSTFAYPVNRFGPGVAIAFMVAGHYFTRGSLDRLKARDQELLDKSAKHYVKRHKTNH